MLPMFGTKWEEGFKHLYKRTRVRVVRKLLFIVSKDVFIYNKTTTY